MTQFPRSLLRRAEYDSRIAGSGGPSVLEGLRLPVLVVNGSHDIVIPTINSYILQQFLPRAELVLYPDANHGAHFQYPKMVADVTRGGQEVNPRPFGIMILIFR
jgi:pimeloyl-ACP methyl ester carboxylesterase